MNETCSAITLFLYCSAIIAMLIVSYVSVGWISDDIETGKLSSYSQFHKIRDDWQAPFITGVFVIDKTETCKSSKADSHDIFHYDWYGLRQTFIMSSGQLTGKRDCGKNCKNESFDGIPMIQVNILKDKRICGIRQKVDVPGYQAMVQPDLITGKCPSNWKLSP